METIKPYSDFFINRPGYEIPATLTTQILAESNALQYHSSLDVYQPTPLVSLPNLALKYGVGEIYVKNEAFRFGLNAFKGLGASYAINQILKKSGNISTFCTATDGNHGRAVAWASKLAGKKSVIFVPKNTAINRIEAIEREGGIVIVTDDHYDRTCEIAAETSKKKGWKLVQDTSWEGFEEIPALIMAGYLTQFREMESTLHLLPKPKIDIVFLQAGVGSWAGAGIWYYLNRYGKNKPKIIIVEPYEAAGIFESFKAGERIIPKGSYQTIMAGLNCGIPSLYAWEIIKNGADAALRIPDEYAERAVSELYYPHGDDLRITAGESGAGGLAGFISVMTNPNLEELKEELQISKETTVLLTNTEGATDLEGFIRIVNGGG